MFRILIPAAMVGAVAFGAAASASSYPDTGYPPHRATGIVASYNPQAETLTLRDDNVTQDGITYYLTKAFDNPGLHVGSRVRLTWEMVENMHHVSDLTLVK